MLPDDLSVFDLDRSLAAFRGGGGEPAPALIATGSRPDADRRDRLRRAGVHLALWNPVDDATLRFQLNTALAASGLMLGSRRSERVPTNWPVGVRSSGRLEPAKIYSLSDQGAFVATSAPSMPEAIVFFDLPLPGEDVSVAAEVVMANLPGSLVKQNLPIGMGVRFRGMETHVLEALAAYTAERSSQLRL